MSVVRTSIILIALVIAIPTKQSLSQEANPADIKTFDDWREANVYQRKRYVDDRKSRSSRTIYLTFETIEKCINQSSYQMNRQDKVDDYTESCFKNF
jgi:hypothetical protein